MLPLPQLLQLNADEVIQGLARGLPYLQGAPLPSPSTPACCSRTGAPPLCRRRQPPALQLQKLHFHRVSAAACCWSTRCTRLLRRMCASIIPQPLTIMSQASFTATDCTFSQCALSGLEARDASTATLTQCEVSGCRQSGVMSCDEVGGGWGWGF